MKYCLDVKFLQSKLLMSVQDVRGMQKRYEGLVRVSSEVSKHANGNGSCDNFLLHFMFFLWDIKLTLASADQMPKLDFT